MLGAWAGPSILAVNPVPWARAQMAFTLAFHIILVPLGVSWAFMALIANYRGLKHDDVLLIFPEGQNFSPDRRRRLIDRLREAGQELKARRAISLWNTLPPKTRGVIACLDERPDADVMIVAHAGFGQLTTPKEIWDAIPFTDRPFLVRTQTYAASDVPDEPAGIERWLDEHWTEIDQWVATYEGSATP